MSRGRSCPPERGRGWRGCLAGAAVLLVLAGALTACQDGGEGDVAGLAPKVSSAPVTLKLDSSIPKGATDVPVDKALTVTAAGGTIKSVKVSSAEGAVAGSLSGDDTRWRATGRLEPGTTYTVTTLAERSDGKQITRKTTFKTQNLTLDQQTYPSIAPLDGQTVGVGMPVIVRFDVPVTDRAAIEKHMTVTATPRQPGSWHWISDNEVHWRPKHYWKAGSNVQVNVDIDSIPAGNGIYGQLSRTIDFHVGAAHVYKVNAQTHQMKVYSNGKLLRTIPVTTGKPGFVTRSGVKVIMQKYPSIRMNSQTIGIDPGNPNYYNLPAVLYAMRLTNSGEFIHAAPWSVADQGLANVSHGCTGLSTANAKWLYDMSREGDVVETTGTDRHMTLTNGFGDWNESFAQYRKGSALYHAHSH